MTTIILQGTHYVLGLDIALSIGYNAKGKKVITKSVLSLNAAGELVCLNGGIKIKITDQDLEDFYPNTAASKRLLKQKMA